MNTKLVGTDRIWITLFGLWLPLSHNMAGSFKNYKQANLKKGIKAKKLSIESQ